MAGTLNAEPAATEPTAYDTAANHQGQTTEPGVERADAPVTGLSKTEKWLLWPSMVASFYVLGLNSFTMAVYLIDAASLFNSTVQYSTLAVIESMILAIGQPPFAKLADIIGRPWSWVFSLGFYVLGTIIMAACHDFATLATGVVFYAIGYTGITFLQQLVLADLVPPNRRVLVSNLLLFHYFINFGVAGKITGALEPDHWRWGPAMFTILIPVVNAPIVVVLFLQQHKQRHSADYERTVSRFHGLSLFGRLKELVLEFDLLGLFLISAAFCLLLVPLTIATEAPHGYSSGYIVAMFVLGAVALVTWPFVELAVPRPLVHLREFALNIDIVLPSLIYAVDQFSTTLSYQPALQWVEVTFNYSTSNAVYFYYAQSLSNVAFSMVAGAVSMYTRHYKWVSFFGGCLRVLGVGLMMRYRTTGSSTAQLVIPQIIQGIGGGMLTANLLVAAQQSVAHARVAIVTAVVLLIINLGDAIGSAVTGAVQQNLQGLLHHYVDPVVAGNATVATLVYEGGASAAELYPLGTPVRDAISAAWSANMHQLLIGALVSGIINALMCLGMPDRQLASETQNNVTDERLGVSVDPQPDAEKKAETTA
ncbi:hypothetical protein SCUCBS95973_005250 [Sporothrix curviconia]|uniref:Major facilitator superfamily (MFS) profile domain-containing protein n=1 Tax=Sporothrix curviconia TaxID=1260050 RepID=A0ABP0BVP9_9PEZI